MSLAAALVAVLAVVLLMAVGSDAAGSPEKLPYLAYFGQEGAAAGQLNRPVGVAVDNSTGASKGDVYVADAENHRVDKFGSEGKFDLAFGAKVNKDGANVCLAGEECQAGTTGSGSGQFDGPGGVAVDPTSGAVYVADVANHRVEKFGPEGKFELMFGGKVNKNGTNLCKAGEECQAGTTASSGEEGEGKFHAWHFGSFIAVGATGTVYVGDENRVQEFNANGEYQAQIKLPGFGTVTMLAVNSSGDVFARAFETNVVHAFDPTGGELHAFDFTEPPEELAVDPETGDVYVGYVSGGSGQRVQEYEGSGVFSLLAEAEPGLVQASKGLAVGRHGTLYAADLDADKIVMFGDVPTEGLQGALASINSTYLVRDGYDSAELAAVVNSGFLSGTYDVEYGRESSYGSVSATRSLTSIAEISEVASLEGLQPETEYHYRFVVTTAAGVEYGPDEVFVTYGASQTGLPDGRVYEQVSPVFKNGNYFDPTIDQFLGLAEAGGNGVVYPMSGAVGASDAGIIGEFVSRHVPGGGWTTAQVTSRPTSEISKEDAPSFLLPSSNFARFLFADEDPFSNEEPFGFRDTALFANIFVDEVLLGESGDLMPPSTAEWVTRPRIDDPVPVPGKGPSVIEPNYTIVGASPDLDRVYFAYAGTLLPEDAERAVHVGSGLSDGNGARSEVYPWGFYEWDDGVLREAGVLPDGETSAYGAVPAALGLFASDPSSRSKAFQAGAFDNVVSEDGERAFFVSPDPLASSVTDPEGCGKQPANCTSEAPQLYVREVSEGGAPRVALVSGSQLQDGSEGTPAAGGVTAVRNPTYGVEEYGGATYAFASPDGSHVFFASVSRLTEAAPENAVLKEYDYDVETGVLTYLPGVEGSIDAVGAHGETFMFVTTNEAPWPVSGSPWSLKVWHAGAGGGSVVSVATLPDATLTEPSGSQKPQPRVRSAHISTDGGVFVFSTNAPIEGFNDVGEAGAEGTRLSALQIYRYDVVSRELVCVSCAPAGVRTAGDAYMSYNNYADKGEEVPHANGLGATYPPQTTQEARGMSANGERIFFDTPTPLVSQAKNSKRDVYEWENGQVYLISSGSASENSYYLDNSESGDDVFFATSAGLVPGDTDEAYDIYDARVPRPGDTTPPEIPPCKGSVCQGPPSTPELLGAPPSETFSGPGNPFAAPEVKPAVASKPKAKAKAKKKRKKRKRSKGKVKKAKKGKKAASSESDRGAKR